MDLKLKTAFSFILKGLFFIQSNRGLMQFDWARKRRGTLPDTISQSKLWRDFFVRSSF